LVKLCQHIWTLATPDDDGCLDGGQMRPLMMMSGLTMDVLGEVWAMVDDEQHGKVGLCTRTLPAHVSQAHLPSRSIIGSWASCLG
jgi:hypothetical protein